jgi:transposase
MSESNERSPEQGAVGNDLHRRAREIIDAGGSYTDAGAAVNRSKGTIAGWVAQWKADGWLPPDAMVARSTQTAAATETARRRWVDTRDETAERFATIALEASAMVQSEVTAMRNGSPLTADGFSKRAAGIRALASVAIQYLDAADRIGDRIEGRTRATSETGSTADRTALVARLFAVPDGNGATG